MNLEVIVQNLPRLLEGALLTVELLALAVVIGGLLALPIGLARVAEPMWLRMPAWGYVFFFRGTPLLVQIFLIYYGLGQFETVRESVLWPFLREPYWCAIIAFALNTAGYVAEILRGAIQAVPANEIEAAKAFGMGTALRYRRIILPRAVRIALPAYGNEIILLLKASALASTITLLDLTGMARTVIARTYLPVEFFLTAGVIYLILTFLITRAFRFLERRANRYLIQAR